MKKVLISLLLLLLSVTSQAKLRSIVEMKSVANSILNEKINVTRAAAGPIEVFKTGEQFTVLGYKTGGYVIVANDDNFSPVLGYSEASFSLDNIPPAMQWWLNAVNEALKNNLKSMKRPVTGLSVKDNKYPESVDVLMTTEWDQSEPFNSVIAQELGDNYLTGCVATAMAQVMKYHNYPISGEGYKSYMCMPSGGSPVQLNVDFEATTYDWNNMLDFYNPRFGNYTDEQANAVGTLMFHCGVAVDMSYGLDASGSHNYSAAAALSDYFKYSTKYYYRDIYSTEEWMDVLYNELANKRPVLYGGSTPDNFGHSFVIDGYDSRGLVHVNWGWSGAGTAYCDVAVLNSGQGSFSEGQDMVLIHDDEDPEIPYASQWGILPSAAYTNGQTVKGVFSVSVDEKYPTDLICTATNLFNMDSDLFTGNLALMAQPVDGGAPEIINSESLRGIKTYAGFSNYNRTMDASILPDGEYRLYLATKATKESEWQIVHSNEDIVNNYILTKNGENLSVVPGESGWTNGIVNIVMPNVNDGMTKVYDIQGRLLYTSSTADFNLSDVNAHGLIIIKDANGARKVLK